MVRISYVSDMRKWTGHKPLLLTGAVVIIVNPLGQLLLQLREDGTYGLPGGLAELGESLEEAAGIALPPVYYRAIRKYVKGPFT